MAVWTYEARDLRTGARLGELPLGNVVMSELLNRPGDLTADIDLAERSGIGQRLSQALLDATVPRRTVIWCHRDNRIIDGYIVWQRYKAMGSSRLLQIRGSSLLSYFDHRLLTVTKTYTAVDQHDIARDLVNFVQQATGGNIGIVNNTTNDSGVLRDRQPLAFHYERKNIGEALRQLAAVDGGFDFNIDTALVNDLPQATFRCYYPRRGRPFAQNNVTFTLGRMLIDYSLLEDGPRTANSIHGIGAGEGTDMLLRTAPDTSEIDQGYPLLEDATSHKDINQAATLLGHAQAELKRRARENATWELSVEPDDESIPLGSWTVGDDCRVVIPGDDRFPNGFDVELRIIGQTIRPHDDGGIDDVTLEMGALFQVTQAVPPASPPPASPPPLPPPPPPLVTPPPAPPPPTPSPPPLTGATAYRVVGTGDSILAMSWGFASPGNVILNSGRWLNFEYGRAPYTKGLANRYSTNEIWPLLNLHSKAGGWVIVQDNSLGTDDQGWTDLMERIRDELPHNRNLVAVLPGFLASVNPSLSATIAARATIMQTVLSQRPRANFVDLPTYMNAHPSQFPDGQHPDATAQAWIRGEVQGLTG